MKRQHLDPGRTKAPASFHGDQFDVLPAAPMAVPFSEPAYEFSLDAQTVGSTIGVRAMVYGYCVAVSLPQAQGQGKPSIHQFDSRIWVATSCGQARTTKMLFVGAHTFMRRFARSNGITYHKLW